MPPLTDKATGLCSIRSSPRPGGDSCGTHRRSTKHWVKVVVESCRISRRPGGSRLRSPRKAAATSMASHPALYRMVKAKSLLAAMTVCLAFAILVLDVFVDADIAIPVLYVVI